MARIEYTREFDPHHSAKAMRYEMHISPKASREIARTIRGMTPKSARQLLEDVISMKRAVPYRWHVGGVGHRKGKVGPGRFPQKCAKEFLKLLENAESNASYKGLNPERMRIAHVCAKRGRVIRGIIPRAMGRATAKNTETVSLEMVLVEV
ncbi:MAG: 50S ribosomal protein L22 [Methermicoccaceae archaeon]